MTVPTILIPGIQGTKLVNSNTLNFDTIWSVVQSKYETIYDLALRQDGRYDLSPKSIIERSDVEDLAYREVVYVLENKTNMPVYTFGYDWRKSSVHNARRLADFVEYLKEKLSVTSFNFIAHSLGGIVFSCYLSNLQGDYSVIEHAIFAACPLEGSISALIALAVGEGSLRFPLFNSNDEFRRIARTFPSVYELCPIYKGAVVFRDGTNFDLFNPDHWQSNIGHDDRDLFLERLRQTKLFRETQNPAMQNLGSLPKEVRKKFLIIAGEGEDTKTKVIVEPLSPDGRAKNFFNFDTPGSEGRDGDGVVPLQSAAIYKDTLLTLAVRKRWNTLAMHGLLLNDGRVQTLITRFLQDRTLEDSKDNQWWSILDSSVRKL